MQGSRRSRGDTARASRPRVERTEESRPHICDERGLSSSLESSVVERTSSQAMTDTVTITIAAGGTVLKPLAIEHGCRSTDLVRPEHIPYTQKVT